MDNNTRRFLRNTSKLSTAVGVFLAMGLAGALDLEDERREMSSAEIELQGLKPLTENQLNRMTTLTALTLGGGLLGLKLTEKRKKER